MAFADKPIFYNSSLLFSEQDMEKLTKATVVIAGLGGVGAIAAELMVRTGIGNLKLADDDSYQDTNLNRQLFSTLDTLGINKAIAAYKRLKRINPEAQFTIFEDGVNLSNIEKFCNNADVIICQPDRPSTVIIIERYAKEKAIPVVSGSRESLFGHRWSVCADVKDFTKYPDLSCYGDHCPEIESLSFSELTEEILNNYDEKTKVKMTPLFNENIKSKPELFGSISQECLFDRIKSCDRYANRHNCSIVANTSGCLAAASALRILLGGPEGKLEINLWEGL
ncbi:putative ThiF family adenylyltransferase [Candidatus Magnetomoraceae bacterium gMMP-1]